MEIKEEKKEKGRSIVLSTSTPSKKKKTSFSLSFVRADADAFLLSAKTPPRDAYRGRSVWITGASQGLGARLALEYYRLGAHVILSSRSEERLRAVAAAVVRAGGGGGDDGGAGAGERAAAAATGKNASPPPPPAPTVLPFDALAPYAKLEEAASRAAEAAREAWAEREKEERETERRRGPAEGSSPSSSSSSSPPTPPPSPRLALLVLCAGASQHAAAAATTAEVSDAILELNAAAPIRLTRAALPHLLETAAAAAAAARAAGAGAGAGAGGEIEKKKKKGASSAPPFPPAASVLGVSSMAALVPSPGQAAYSASKAALALYLRSVEAELFDRGLRTTTVYPGPLSSSPSSSSSSPGATSGSSNEDDDRIFSTTAVRTVYGSSGLKREGAEAVSSKAKEDRKRLDGGRAAALIATAGYRGIGEALLGRHPVLLLGHLARGSFGVGIAGGGGIGGSGLPQRLLRAVLSKVGPARAAALEEGRGGYDAGALLSSSAGAGAGGKKRA